MAIVLHVQNGATGVSTCQVPLQVGNVPERFLLLIAAVADRTKTMSTTPTWRPNGTSSIGTDQVLTQLGSFSSSASGATLHYEAWYLLAPNASSNSGSFIGTWTWGATIPSIQSATVWSGVHQTTPWTGYPAVPTNMATQEVDGTASTTWPTLAVTSVAGDYVVDTAAAYINTALAINAASGQTMYQDRYTQQASGNTRILSSAKAATGASTTMGWVAGTVGFTFLQMGFPLKPSASLAPYWVEPQSTAVTAGGSVGDSTLTVNDTTNFPASGRIYLGEVNHATTAVRTATYTSKTSTTFTLSPTLAVAALTGDRVTELPSASGVGTSLAVLMPLAAAANDIMVLNLYAAETGAWTVPVTHPGPAADFTAINAVVGTAYRQDTYWRRISAADIATPPTFTFTGAASVQRTAAVALYRGCIAAGSPIGVGGAAPTTNSGASGSQTALGLTTAAVDYTIVGLYADNGTSLVWNPYATATSGWAVSERVDLNQTYLTDAVVLAASTTGNKAVGGGSQADPWAAQMIALIPAGTAPVTYTRALTRTGVVSETPSKAASTYHKAVSRTGTVSGALSRAASTFKRALTRTGTITDTLKDTLSIFHRTLTRTGSVAEVLSKAGSTYRRSLSRSGGVTEVVNFVKNSVAPILRSLSRIGTVSVSVKKSGSTYHKAITRTGTVVELTSRGLSTYRRSASRTGTVTESVKKTPSVYHKTLVRTGAVLEAVTRTISSVGQSFFTFGTFPILRLWEPAEFISPTVFFEADLVSSVLGTAVFARLFDVTASTAVTGSQITTVSPHNVQQRVRSSAISLVSGHVYRAEVGRTSGVVVTIASADLIVEVP